MSDDNDPCGCPHCDKIFRWGEDADSAIVANQGVDWISCRKNAYWKLTFHMQETHADQLMRCGRRGPWIGGNSPFRHDKAEKGDYWGVREHHMTCSYCGSIHPDELFAAIERGDEIAPTDKNYKIYVDLPNPDAGKSHICGSSSGPVSECLKNIGREPTAEEIEAGSYSEPLNGTHGAHIHAKFYFQHLDAEQQQRFVDLANASKIKIGYPGHFYRLPFFMSR